MAKRIIWKVDLPPTGKYRSFGRRAWPSAHYRDEQETPAVMITCKTDYSPQKAKEKKPCPVKAIHLFSDENRRRNQKIRELSMESFHSTI